MAIKEKRGKGWRYYFAVMLSVLLLYVLSVGPATGLVSRSDSRTLHRIYHIVYRPLTWLAYDTDYGRWIQWWAWEWQVQMNGETRYPARDMRWRHTRISMRRA